MPAGELSSTAEAVEAVEATAAAANHNQINNQANNLEVPASKKKL